MRPTSSAPTAPLPMPRTLPKRPSKRLRRADLRRQVWRPTWPAPSPGTPPCCIGIPMKGGATDGLDALLATVQMPSGIPVATVALGGTKNAAVLAARSGRLR